jgi:ATP-binding cassette subfamily F protein 3
VLQVSNVTKSFGDNLIFEDVSFVVNPGDRVGLIGPNGCGKTTLLRIVLGEIQPDAGRVRLSPPDLRVGYQAQALAYEPGQTVGRVILGGIAGLAEAEHRMESVTARIATAREAELGPLLAEYDRALEAFERLGGYRIQSRMGAVLSGLDLEDLDLDVPVDLLSGGQKTRLGLARLLLSRSRLLLLDEPTNHLDIEALDWLEGFLREFEGAALVVSHDRSFLNNAVDTILELDPSSCSLAEYPGTYRDYVEAKEQERQKQWAAYKDQQEFIARLQSTIAEKKGYARSIELGTIDFGPRKIAKGIARRAVVQQRRLQRILDSEKRIDKPDRSWQMKLEFVHTPSSGRDVLQMDGVTMGFGEQVLFRDVTLALRAGERIALVGANGSGKTTLARLILGELEPWAGRVHLGTGVKIGYYAQEQENLDPDSTPYETIRAVASMNQTEIRSFLHYFLFGGEEVFVPVGSLSLGERARLVLARLVAQGCNFLLLDEPINHLDIPSRTRFEEAMAAFKGTVLAIVHDRYFIERFATGLWALKDGTIRTYIDREDMQRHQGRE